MKYLSHWQSPLGGMTLASDGEALTGLWFDGQKYFPAQLTGKEKDLALFRQVRAWLESYFRKENPPVDFPLNAEGSPFSHRVWEILRQIPYGSTMTYGQIARILQAQKILPIRELQPVPHSRKRFPAGRHRERKPQMRIVRNGKNRGIRNGSRS